MNYGKEDSERYDARYDDKQRRKSQSGVFTSLSADDSDSPAY